MSDHREEIRARVEKATPGPWIADEPHSGKLDGPSVWGDGMLVGQVAGLAGFDYANAEFIAHARSDIPDLLSELQALRRENARLKGALEEADEAMQYVLPELPQFPPPCSYSVLRAAHRVVDAALSSSPAQEQKQ